MQKISRYVHREVSLIVTEIKNKKMPLTLQNPHLFLFFQIANHMKLRHPHVISLREVFLTQQHLVLVMEFAPGGDLFTYVRSRGGLPETEARWYFQQIVIAIDYCHRLGVCSRDIKLENTLLDAQPGPQGKIYSLFKNTTTFFSQICKFLPYILSFFYLKLAHSSNCAILASQKTVLCTVLLALEWAPPPTSHLK